MCCIFFNPSFTFDRTCPNLNSVNPNSNAALGAKVTRRTPVKCDECGLLLADKYVLRNHVNIPYITITIY
jgi:hypothetical protein